MSEKAREQIVEYLASRGQQVTDISRIFFSSKLIFGRGVSNIAAAYSVKAVTEDGTINTYTLAYDPLGWAVGQRSGLKRFQNGAWFDAW